jgi:ABC-type phosphate/phosphonate transport system substrate-binding protein
MQYLDKSEADVTTLDPGNVFVGGRYHSLLPIMQEVYTNNQAFYFSVAVVKKFTLPEVQAISQLRGKKACFPGVGIHGG